MPQKFKVMSKKHPDAGDKKIIQARALLNSLTPGSVCSSTSSTTSSSSLPWWKKYFSCFSRRRVANSSTSSTHTTSGGGSGGRKKYKQIKNRTKRYKRR